jgi:hypothetical protein
MLKFLKGLISNNEGVASSMRVVMVLSYIFAVFVPLVVWVAVSILSNPMKMAEFPPNLAWFMGTIVTVVTSGKVVQLFEEQKPKL